MTKKLKRKKTKKDLSPNKKIQQDDEPSNSRNTLIEKNTSKINLSREDLEEDLRARFSMNTKDQV